jgi:hypothetical protein
MQNSKQLTNTVGLKVAFIPQTNTKGNRIKITQTNSNKSVFIDGNTNVKIEVLIASILDKIDLIESYSILVDNTQNKYFIFNLDFKGNSFENILANFKTQ